MRLGNIFWRKQKNLPLNIDNAPIKKALGVDDDYYELLYRPIIEMVERCSAHIEKNKQKLFDDYTDQVCKLVRKTRGRVQSETKKEHFDNFCAVWCFSAFYVSNLLYRFSFYLEDKDQNKVRTELWLGDDLFGQKIMVRKKSVIGNIRHTLISVANTMVVSDAVKKWLYHDPDGRLNAVYEFIYSSGEEGAYTFCITGFRDPLSWLERSTSTEHTIDMQSNGAESDSTDNSDDGVSPEQNAAVESIEASFASLISGANIPTLDDMLNNGSSGVQNETFVHDNSQVVTLSQEPVLEQTQAPQASDILSSFESLLNNTSAVEQETYVDFPTEISETDVNSQDWQAEAFMASLPPIDPQPPVVDESLSSALLTWAHKSIEAGANESHGVYIVQVGNHYCAAIDLDVGLNNFIREDYDLENEQQLDAIKYEFIADINRSELWEKEDSSKVKTFELNGLVGGGDIILSIYEFSDVSSTATIKSIV